MNKKHFNRIAEILSDGYGMSNEQLERITEKFMVFCENVNPKFDRIRFRKVVFDEVIYDE